VEPSVAGAIPLASSSTFRRVELPDELGEVAPVRVVAGEDRPLDSERGHQGNRVERDRSCCPFRVVASETKRVVP
jgi:hypothetical protein